ncbi:hypothetical protein LCGC14_2902750 [marine sediment metagenome]|uniref:Uncharacterized protein n=1 Tax=marine sediment metagenome TaxID=412755 RepID=A0A0F8XUE2_9ZZZZ
MNHYKLKYDDLIAIANSTRAVLHQLGMQGDLLASEQRLEAICAEIEVVKLKNRDIIIVK